MSTRPSRHQISVVSILRNVSIVSARHVPNVPLNYVNLLCAIRVLHANDDQNEPIRRLCHFLLLLICNLYNSLNTYNPTDAETNVPANLQPLLVVSFIPVR